MRKVGGNERVARGVGGLGGHVGTSHGIEDAEGEDGVCHVHRPPYQKTTPLPRTYG